jgi:hypothetical protein
VFSPVNAMAPAKILSDFAKEFEKPRVKAAVVDGRLYDTKAIAVLAKLPSREVLLSQLIGTFVAPMSSFLGASTPCSPRRRTWRTRSPRRSRRLPENETIPGADARSRFLTTPVTAKHPKENSSHGEARSIRCSTSSAT